MDFRWKNLKKVINGEAVFVYIRIKNKRLNFRQKKSRSASRELLTIAENFQNNF